MLINCNTTSEDNLFAILSNITSQRYVVSKDIQVMLWGDSVPYNLLQNKLSSSLNISVLIGNNTKETVLKKCKTNYALYIDNFLFTSPEMLWEIFREMDKYPNSSLQFDIVNDNYVKIDTVNVLSLNNDFDIKSIDLQLGVRI